jgi:orotidine-5'-phosphate decarboxylase
MKHSLIMLALITAASCASSNAAFEPLDRRMISTNSLVSVGLDPDFSKMPTEIIESNKAPEEIVFNFLKEVIDITAPYCCCYKLQKAFYDTFENGHDLLRKTVHYIHTAYPDTPAYIDCKIGDTDNTMKAYMSLLFDDIKADGIVINPYMGDDVFEPFLEDSKKSAIVLIQTSNPNAKIVQELVLEDGKKLWEKILEIALSRWNKNKNLMIVLSSNTSCSNYENIRTLIPQDTPILLAGIGLQGGNPTVLKQLLNEQKRGVIVNSSRGILYPYEQHDENWRAKIKNAVIELKETLNTIRFED